MAAYWTDIFLVGVLVLLNALFAGSEMALVSLRDGQLKQLERDGDPRSLRLVRLARDPNRFLATIQIGITLAGFLASATAAVSLAEPLVPFLTALGSAAEPVAVGGVTIVLTFVMLVLGELAPKRLAMQWALRWALLAARPLQILSVVSRPAVAILSLATDLVVRLAGGRADAQEPQVTHEELRDLVESHRGLNAEQREIIGAALEIHKRVLREVLVPRGAVVAIREDATLAQAREQLRVTGHSRAPVTVNGQIDDIVGVIRWNQLLDDADDAADTDDAVTVGTLAAPALMLPDTLRVSEALRQFRAEHQHFAVVLDEYGSVEGIVTLEDLLEEIVGEIYDETDRDVLAVVREPDGSMTLPGTFPIHDLTDVGVTLDPGPHADFTTVAGLVLSLLGKVPTRPGDVVEVPGWTVEVTALGRHAITAVRLRPDAPQNTEL